MKSHKTYILAGIMLGVLSIAPNTHTAAAAEAVNLCPKDEYLFIAVTAECPTVLAVSMALRAGGSVYATRQNGDMPLHLAPNAEIAELLIKHNAPLDVKNDKGETPLRCMVTRYMCTGKIGFMEAAKVLLNNDANMYEHDELSTRGLHDYLLQVSSLSDAAAAEDGYSPSMIQRAKEIFPLFEETHKEIENAKELVPVLRNDPNNPVEILLPSVLGDLIYRYGLPLRVYPEMQS